MDSFMVIAPLCLYTGETGKTVILTLIGSVYGVVDYFSIRCYTVYHRSYQVKIDQGGITMSKYTEKALENHKNGMNCAQAVACAFADALGMDENVIFQMTEGFGAGMGGMEATCGAVSGAVLLTGIKLSSADAKNPVTKGKTYQLSREITKAFKLKNGTLVCKELKGVETKKVIRSCDGCIEDAAGIVEKVLGL